VNRVLGLSVHGHPGEKDVRAARLPGMLQKIPAQVCSGRSEKSFPRARLSLPASGDSVFTWRRHMSEEQEKWTVQRVRQDIYDARTKVFVVAKVLETGKINFADQSEWAVVLRPLLKELIENSEKISAIIDKAEEA
jgi:hypothetical protein